MLFGNHFLGAHRWGQKSDTKPIEVPEDWPRQTRPINAPDAVTTMRVSGIGRARRSRRRR